jgi:hypothetical protein
MHRATAGSGRPVGFGGDVPFSQRPLADLFTCFIWYVSLIVSNKGQTPLGDFTAAGLRIVNSYPFPPGRSWLRAPGG